MLIENRIRARAKAMLKRQGVKFDNDVSNATLVMLARMSRLAIKDEKEINRQKQRAIELIEGLEPIGWFAANKIQVEAIMKHTKGVIHKYNMKYWVSFKPAWKVLSFFVRERANVADDAYYVTLADARVCHPWREWRMTR